MGCSKCLSGLAYFLATGCAAAIIVLVALKMNRVDVTVDPKTMQANTQQVCYLGTSLNGINLCYAAYGISGVSLLATLALSILLCCTCNLCGFGFLLETAFAAVGAAAWALAGVVLTQSRERNASLPQAKYRDIIFILTWAACGLFALMFLANLFSMFASCCRCMGSKGRRGAKARSSAYDMEAPTGKVTPSQQFMYGDTSAYQYRH